MSLILNDLHLGVHRTGGTTPLSQLALRENLRNRVASTLDDEDGEVTINGDMLDGFTVDTVEVVLAYEVFSNWLQGNSNRTLNLCQGNHDANPRGGKLSSFHLLTHFLTCHFPDRVRVFDKGLEQVNDNIWCIPHQPNQALFDIELGKAAEMDGTGKYLLTHCNIKNTFAEHSDHSLNLADPYLGNLMKAGWTIINGHEHQGYELRGGRIVVVGNQFPSSVADCLGERYKKAIRITDKGVVKVTTWKPENSFTEIDWRDLTADAIQHHNFFRVTGDASAAEAADVINTISRFRQRCTPEVFVITNAVKIEGQSMITEMAQASVENLKAFDVLSTILEHLDGKEQEVVKCLLK